MHKHKKESRNSWMNWMMLVHCGLPILILLLLGFSGVNIPASTWILVVATLIVFNVLMRRKHR